MVNIKYLAILFLALLVFNSPRARARQEGGERPRAPQRYTLEGVTVEFSVEPLARGKTEAPQLLEGTDATVRLRITDAAQGTPLTALRPAAWIALRGKSDARDERGCREKVQSFLQASFASQPDVDLNSYFILTLNHEANISVIDPLHGFGSSKLYTLVALRSPGEDWVMSGDRKRLYVSMPLVNQVAVVDIASWKVIANVDTAASPARLVLQHDGRYLWVGDDGDGAAAGGVTVIDTAKLKVAAQLVTGAGHHEIALADDDRYAFVTNRQAGTLSVIDVRALAKTKDVKTGALPSALAFSSLGKAVYVAHEGDGTIVAVDASRHETLATMKAEPGLRAIGFPPGGRFGFAINRATSAAYIFDAATNSLIRSAAVGPSPDQVTFTKDFAYVRSTASEFVSMIKLADIGKADYEAAVSRFPAGQRAPRESAFTSLAASVVPAPEAGAVLVANPADKTIYYYMEGMAAPMGSFQNYRRDPKALLVLDNSLRETSPGVYTANVRLPAKGEYDLAFLLSSPRLVTCFDIAVGENPDMPQKPPIPIKVEALLQDKAPRAGESYQLRFRVIDAASNRPKSDLKDMGVLVFLAPGIWQRRDLAKPVGDGVYEMSFVPPQAGAYYVFFQAPSLGVQFNQLPSLTLEATKEDAAPASKITKP
jgi:YVTN family beta-propeller protein